jgi:hypothetical protein
VADSRERIIRGYSSRVYDSQGCPGACYVEFVPSVPGVAPALAKATPDGSGGWNVRWQALPGGCAKARAELEQEVRRLAALHRQGSGKDRRGLTEDASESPLKPGG